MFIAGDAAAFLDHIGHIVGMSTKEQVIRIDTCSDVAAVKDLQILGDLTPPKLPSYAMRGLKALIVEKITQVESTDVVSSPAAGGRVLRIAASKDKGKPGMKNILKFAEKHGIKQEEDESDEAFTKRVLESKIPQEDENPLGGFIRKISELPASCQILGLLKQQNIDIC